MSRKNAKKRNLEIGIFEGKAAEYNKQILKTLAINGSQTAWEIAKRICNNKFPDISDFELEARSRHVYSVIQRRNGRLDNLKTKGYIITKGNKWDIELKGVIAILILDKTLVNKLYIDGLIPDHFFKPITTKEIKMGPFKIDAKFVNSMAKAIYNDLQNPQTYLRYAEETKLFIDDGLINLDRIPTETLMFKISSSLTKKGKYHKELFP